jgi:MoxR-like ATPase
MATKLKAVPAPTPVPATPSVSATCDSWASLRTAMNKLFPERTDVIDATLCALVAKEHVFYLGPAGTGKSALARAIAQAFATGYFEHLITKFTVPGEVFGEVDLPAWQSTGVYTRNTAGFAPEARIWFLDEAWKGSSAILNALLTALNERKFRNGGTLQNLPLSTCVAASNELPEGEGLDPIYDRFLVRCEVGYIVEDDSWMNMLEAPDPVPPQCTLDLDDEQNACARVEVPHAVIQAARGIANALRKAGHVISDRRWKRSMKLVQARAYLDGRKLAELDDLDILEHALWREPKQRASIARVIQGHISPDGARITELYDEAKDLFEKLSPDARAAKRVALGELGGCSDSLEKLLADLGKLSEGRKQREACKAVESYLEECTKLIARSMGTKLV